MADPTPRRRNRQLMLVVFATPVLIAGIAAAVSIAGPSEPSVSVAPPAGYRAITDAYYGYAVPASWSEDDDATTDTGTYFYQGPSGWAGETLGPLRAAPPEGEAGPGALGVFGTATATPWRLVDGTPAAVSGASAAWRYQLVRGGADVATVLDVWTAGTSTELWIAVHADPATTATVLSTLRA